MILDRRHFMASVGVTISTVLMGNSVHAKAPSKAAKPVNMAEWMDAWTGQNAREPEGGLYVYRFKEPMWALLKPIAWKSNEDSSKIAPVIVPTGFVTDFASIPPAFYSLLRPDGDYTYPAIIHDYLYWMQERPRSECDEVLRLAMQDFNIGLVTVGAIYKAVRSFGGSAWAQNTKLKKAGEKRILKKLPEDPRITWEAWKKDASVF